MLANTPKTSAMVEIDRLGLNWSEEAQYDLSQLDQSRRVQVRDPNHYAPPQQVQQYAVQMGEVQFPAIVVTKNGWLVDGNTRVGAKGVRKEKFSPALVIDVEYGKSPKTDALLHALAATLNQTGGARLTPSEIREVAVTLVKLGWKADAVGRALGVKSSVVANIKRELAAADKFAKVGFTKAKKLSPVVLRTLGTDPLTVLNDVPFKKVAELAVDANLNSIEVRELSDALKKTGSDAGMIKHVDKVRDDMEVRIREHALVGNGKPPASSQLRRVLGFVNANAANPSALVERAPAALADHLTVMQSAVAVLNAVIALQEKVNDE